MYRVSVFILPVDTVIAVLLSRAVVQSRLTWSDYLSMIEALCMPHVCLVYDSRMPCV